MDLDFTPEQHALGESVRRLLADRAPLTLLREQYDEPAPEDAAWPALVELGLVGLDLVDLGRPLEEMGRALFSGPFIASAVTAYSLVRALDDADPLLDEIESGTVVTVAVYEPGRRYATDPEGTVATGDEVSGTKVLVPDAMTAEILLVVTAVDGGTGVFAVPAARAAITPTHTYDGSRRFGEVTLDGARGRRIGGEATFPVFEALDRTSVALVTDGVGAAGRCLELALEYAKTREQFGVPIGSFQSVQHLCADMLQALELGRAGAHYALWATEHPDPDVAHRAAVMAKAWASEHFPRIGATAIQVFGGVGFTWEHDIHLYYKRLLTLAQEHGDFTTHLEELANQLL